MGTCTATIKRATGLTPTGACKIVDIALSSSYATGGDTLTPASCGFKNIDAVDLASAATTPAGHVVEVVNPATFGGSPLLRVRDVATGTEITSTTNLSAQTVRAVIYGDLANP